MRSIDILLVEDNPGDIELTREAIQCKNINADLHVVIDGAEALEYLFKQGKHAEASTPDLVLLDLNLPKVNGLEVLKAVKSDPQLLNIPVVILSSSDADKDIIASYQMHANCYVTKPASLDEFMGAIQVIESFWHQCAVLPGQVQGEPQP